MLVIYFLDLAAKVFANLWLKFGDRQRDFATENGDLENSDLSSESVILVLEEVELDSDDPVVLRPLLEHDERRHVLETTNLSLARL